MICFHIVSNNHVQPQLGRRTLVFLEPVPYPLCQSMCFSIVFLSTWRINYWIINQSNDKSFAAFIIIIIIIFSWMSRVMSAFPFAKYKKIPCNFNQSDGGVIQTHSPIPRLAQLCNGGMEGRRRSEASK